MGSAAENFNSWLKRVTNLSLWDVCSLPFIKSSGWGTGKTDRQPFPWGCTTGNDDVLYACLPEHAYLINVYIWAGRSGPRFAFMTISTKVRLLCCSLMLKRTDAGLASGPWLYGAFWFQEGFLISAYTVVAAQKLWWLTRANSYFSALALPLGYGCAMSPLGLAGLGFMPCCCVR